MLHIKLTIQYIFGNYDMSMRDYWNINFLNKTCRKIWKTIFNKYSINYICWLFLKMKIKTLFLIIILFTAFFIYNNCKSSDALKEKVLFGNINSEEIAIPSKSQDTTLYLVTKVIDGDTFWVDNHSEKGMKVRLIGIDAPESRNVFKKKKQAYGVESKDYLINLLADQYVRLEFDVDSLDQYQRTLAYVYLEDGRFVNELIVKTGNGILLTVAPNIKYESLFYAAQQYAREHNLGLWSVPLEQ